MSSIVRRSASRIWAAFRTRMGTVSTSVLDPEILPDMAKPTKPSKRPLLRHVCDLRELAPCCAQDRNWRYPVVDGCHGRMSTDACSIRNTRSISVFDHGFLYGEGVYETMRTYQRAAIPVRSSHAAAAEFLGHAGAAGAAVGRARLSRALPGDDACGGARTRPDDEAYIRDAPDPRRRRALLRSRGVSGSDGHRHREAADRSAGRSVRARGRPSRSSRSSGTIPDPSTR